MLVSLPNSKTHILLIFSIVKYHEMLIIACVYVNVPVQTCFGHKQFHWPYNTTRLILDFGVSVVENITVVNQAETIIKILNI